MCTGFIKKGQDLIFGYNLDIDSDVWNYKILKNKNCFAICIKVGSTDYLTHGVNKSGNFSNLPYMNGQTDIHSKGLRIDLLTDRFLREKYTFTDVENFLHDGQIVNKAGTSFHSLLSDGNGNAYLIEGEYGYKKIENDYAVISNFPILADLQNYDNPFYGKDRYDLAEKILSRSTDGFGVDDGIDLLCNVKQGGLWGTKVSFVYSRNQNCVYYFTDGDTSTLEKHKFL